MMKFKAGDRVSVRSDLSGQSWYNMEGGGYGCFAVCDMLGFASEPVTIRQCTNLCYKIKEDAHNWNWTDEMFDGFVYDRGMYPGFLCFLNVTMVLLARWCGLR